MSDKYRIDSGKIQWHPLWVAKWHHAESDWALAKKIYPIYVEITTSAACPHRCTFCSTDAIGYPQILIDREKLRNAMAEMAGGGTKSVMFAGTGEPLLHKKINQIVGDAMAFGLDVAFTTNGVLLHKLHTLPECSWVKVSVNAGTRESYAAIHQTDEKDWDRVWANIADGAKRKGNCALGVQAVVLPENYKDMVLLAQRARDAGADYLVLKPYSQATFSIVQRQIDYTEIEEELLALAENYKGFVVYRANAVAQERKPHQYDKCRATPFAWAYLMADGRVFTCSAHLLDERFCIGNINEQPFNVIWQGERRRENWKLMRETFDVSNCRLNCRQNQTNIFLHQIAHGIDHQNFV